MKRIGVLLLVACVVQVPLMGQWLKQPTAGLPRTPDGKPDLAAPVPRGEAGRPVLSGLWRPAPSQVVVSLSGRRTVSRPRLSVGLRTTIAGSQKWPATASDGAKRATLTSLPVPVPAGSRSW